MLKSLMTEYEKTSSVESQLILEGQMAEINKLL